MPTSSAMTMASSGSAGRSRVTDPTVRTNATIADASSAPRTSPSERTDDAEDERLGEHERHDLAATRAGGPQQADLADPFGDGHRQRVEDQERAGEQGDRGDQRGRRLEVGGRRAQRGGQVLRRGQDVRLRGQARLERGDDRRPGRAGAEADVDAASRRLVEDGLGGLQRDDDRPPGRPVSGPSPARIPMTR